MTDSEFSLFQSHPDPMWIYDVEALSFLAVNDAAVERYGYSEREFRAMTIKDIRPAEDVPPLLDVTARLAGGMSDSGIWRHQLKSGEVIPVEIRSHGVQYRGRRARLVTARDVSRLVELERENRALLERERAARHEAEKAAGYFRSLFEGAPGKYLVLRAEDDVMLSASDEFLHATMTRREDVEGRRVFEIFPDDPDDPQADGTKVLRESLDKVKRTGSAEVVPLQRYPLRRPADQGGVFEERYWSAVATPIGGGGRSLAFIVLQVKDITDYVRRRSGDPHLHQGHEELLAERLELDVFLRARELQQANERLRARERQLANTQRIARLGSWELEVERDRFTWSAEVYRIYGVEPQAFGHHVDALLELVHPNDRDRVCDEIDAAARGERDLDLVHRIIRPDGFLRHLQASAQRSSDERESPVLSGTVQDITDIVQAQEESHRLAEQLRETLESITDAFFTLDRDWRITFANREALSQLGIEAADVVDRELWDAFPAAADSGFERNYRHAMASGEAVTFEEYYPPMDKYFDVRAYPTADGLAVYFRDVTAQRVQREQLMLLESAVARLNDMIVITEAEPLDEPGPRIVYVNEAFEKFTGYTRDESIGRSPRFLQGPRTNRRALDRIRRAMQNEESCRVELINYAKDGSELSLEIEVAPLYDVTGTLSHFVAVERDVTEQRRLEEELRQAQRLDAVGQLTGGVAHDFNNLLTVILGNADLLVDQLDDERLRRLAEMNRTAAERGSELTNRLLAFARRQALDPQATDVNTLLTGMYDLLQRTLGEHVEIELEQSSGLWEAMVDPGQLETALLNLCINARDAMPGGGRLTLATANVDVNGEHHVDVLPGPYVTIAVSDTGTGMPAEVAERAFEPFFTTKETGKGSGLGLSMVYGFAKQSSGHVKIDSRPESGTTVTLYLPRAAFGSAEPADVREPTEVVGGTERILLVEDDDIVRTFVTAQLEDLGYRVMAVANGPEALDALTDRGAFDLLFTDMVMPGGMNGRELADAARQIEPQLPVLFTTGYTEEGIVHQGRLDHGVQVLHKPYHRAELAAKIRQVLLLASAP